METKCVKAKFNQHEVVVVVVVVVVVAVVVAAVVVVTVVVLRLKDNKDELKTESIVD